jgi:hypothetical protein
MMPFVIWTPNAPITPADDRIRSDNRTRVTHCALYLDVLSVPEAVPIARVVPSPEPAPLQISPRLLEF